jgi:hypothetical protein
MHILLPSPPLAGERAGVRWQKLLSYPSLLGCSAMGAKEKNAGMGFARRCNPVVVEPLYNTSNLMLNRNGLQCRIL